MFWSRKYCKDIYSLSSKASLNRNVSGRQAVMPLSGAGNFREFVNYCRGLDKSLSEAGVCVSGAVWWIGLNGRFKWYSRANRFHSSSCPGRKMRLLTLPLLVLGVLDILFSCFCFLLHLPALTSSLVQASLAVTIVHYAAFSLVSAALIPPCNLCLPQTFLECPFFTGGRTDVSGDGLEQCLIPSDSSQVLLSSLLYHTRNERSFMMKG